MEQNNLTVETLLGNNTISEYSDIFPALALIFYDTTNRYPKTKSFDMQKKIMYNLAVLKEKTGFEVMLRFPPSINPRMRSLCQPVAENLGLKISESTNVGLMEDMCSSRVVFGTLSSVMSTAVIMGRKVYRISDVKPLFTEKEISVVSCDDIKNINDDWSAYPLPLEKNRFINYEILLK